jgi:hypothetical protein
VALAVFGDVDRQADGGNGQSGSAYEAQGGEVIGLKRSKLRFVMAQGSVDRVDELHRVFMACAFFVDGSEFFIAKCAAFEVGAEPLGAACKVFGVESG